MNITKSTVVRSSEPSRANALALRNQIQEELKVQREETAALKDSGEISGEEYRQSKDFFNQHDLNRARKQSRNISTIVKTVAGIAVGSVAGYQGGWVGGVASGLAGGSISDGIHFRKDSSPGLTLGSSVLSIAAMGFAGSQGGIVGALAGGIGGAIAANYGGIPIIPALLLGV